MVYVIDMCPQANVSEIFLGGNGMGTKVLDRILKDHEDRKTIGGNFDSRIKATAVENRRRNELHYSTVR